MSDPDFSSFQRRLLAAVARVSALVPYRLDVLGEVGGKPLYLLTPEKPAPEKPHILIAAGFHGDEKAGPLGLLSFLETASAEDLQKANLSFLPLVNPTGYDANTRCNVFGDDPNRGFLPPPEGYVPEDPAENTTPSAEGKILLQHGAALAKRGADGFLSLHEDDRVQEAYVFINERAEKMPSAFAAAIVNAQAKHFSLLPDGGAGEFSNVPVKGGVWHNDAGRSFDDWMYQQGAKVTATTETPALADAANRIACNKEIIGAFAGYFVPESNVVPVPSQRKISP